MSLSDDDIDRLVDRFVPIAQAAAQEAADDLTVESLHRALTRWGANGGGELIRSRIAEEVAPIRAAVLGDPESMVQQPGLVQTVMDIRDAQVKDRTSHAANLSDLDERLDEVARKLVSREAAEDRRNRVALAVITAVGTIGVPTATIILSNVFG